MMSNAEKRAGERHGYSADIAVSYFNEEPAYHAEILNLGTGGMCFKSNLALQPGSTICVRLKNSHQNGSCTGYCEGIRSVALADVKWCNEIPGTRPSSYGVGVKYYAPVY
jgi:hypothetical protein